jgi:ceramide glucosyltransferase
MEGGRFLFWVCLLVWASSFLWLMGTVAAALMQPRKRRTAAAGGAATPVSIVVPTSSRDTPRTALERDKAVASLLELRHPRYEIIVCVDRGDADSVLVARLKRSYAHRLVTVASATEQVSANAKVDAMITGVDLARHNVVLFSDDDIEVDAAHLDRLLAHLAEGVGLVSAAAVGTEPTNFWGELELAFMNGQFARLHLAGDFLGFSGALGKAMMIRRQDLPRICGLLSIGLDCCEDAALSRNVKKSGLRVALSDKPVLQPVRDQRFQDVFRRHRRWLSCRRKYLPVVFVAEAISSAAVASLAGGVVTAGIGFGATIGVLATLGLWAAADSGFALLKRWPWRPHSILVWLVREIIFLPMWVAALLARTVTWHGRRVPVVTS